MLVDVFDQRLTDLQSVEALCSKVPIFARCFGSKVFMHRSRCSKLTWVTWAILLSCTLWPQLLMAAPSRTFHRRPLPEPAIAFSSQRGRQLFEEALAHGGGSLKAAVELLVFFGKTMTDKKRKKRQFPKGF